MKQIEHDHVTVTCKKSALIYAQRYKRFYNCDQLKTFTSYRHTVFDLITAPALITPPPDFLLYFHLLSPT